MPSCTWASETVDYRVFSRVGRRVPTHCTAIGKVILAYQDTTEWDRVLQNRDLKKYTPNTVVCGQTLRQQLQNIKMAGFSVAREEFIDGVTAVAVPVFDDDGHVAAAISAKGPSKVFHAHRIHSYVREMQTYSRLLKEML